MRIVAGQRPDVVRNLGLQPGVSVQAICVPAGRFVNMNLNISNLIVTFVAVMSKVKALYHIVFCTKNRRMTIPPANKEDLYRFIWRIIEDHHCKLLRIGGIQNHVHMLIDLHPTVALSNLMQVIKGCSSNWMKSDSRFQAFEGWSPDYFGYTLSPEARFAVIEYIKNQESHHLGQPMDNEIIEMYRYADLAFNDRDMR